MKRTEVAHKPYRKTKKKMKTKYWYTQRFNFFSLFFFLFVDNENKNRQTLKYGFYRRYGYIYLHLFAFFSGWVDKKLTSIPFRTIFAQNSMFCFLLLWGLRLLLVVSSFMTRRLTSCSNNNVESKKKSYQIVKWMLLKLSKKASGFIFCLFSCVQFSTKLNHVRLFNFAFHSCKNI